MEIFCFEWESCVEIVYENEKTSLNLLTNNLAFPL